jgi:Galactose oxidase, central domain
VDSNFSKPVLPEKACRNGKGANPVMKHVLKIFSAASLLVLCLVLAACSGIPGGNTGGGTGTFTISATVNGLSGTGLVLQDNGKDNLTVTANGIVTFATKIATGGAYAVTVFTQPSNPAQTCTVTSGTGTATANVTTVAVTCTTNPVTATIGGTVSNLAPNSSLILQNNGGDSLTVTANGPFTFKTPVTGPTDAYAVAVLTQPNSPNQICTVGNGSGTATANVTNVAVSCVLSYTIGGTVTGLAGTGMILQNSSDLEQLTITGNGVFTFVKLVPTGTAYTITIASQPTGPVQTCQFTTGTNVGVATSNVISVAVTCAAVTYSVGGTVVGLQGISPNNGPLTDSSFSLQNNLGNTLIVSQNGPFNFATPEALNDQYNVSVFTLPTTQPQRCTTWNFKGVVTANITDIVVDCAHNDWTWIDGTKTAGTIAAPQYGSFPTSAPTLVPNPYTNTPGARHSAAGWTDNAGNLWLFGGLGWELTGNPAPDTLDLPMNDLWVCPMVGDQCQWQLVSGYNVAYGAAIIANAQNEDQLGVYSNVGVLLPFPTPVPGARWGMATWTDNSGNLWLFGGNGNSDSATGLLNDLWEFNASSFNASNLTTAVGQWSWVGGSKQINQPGAYTGGTLVPGARVNSVTWKDSSGNFWLFGGYGFDGSANEGFLSDLWEYTGGKWVFVSGSNLANQNGVYGTQGTPSASNAPGGRQEAVGWADANGNLWLFGGEGQDSVGTANGILNDLWEYNIASNQWTFVMGNVMANQTGVYEAQPVVGPVSTMGAANTCGLTVGLLVNGVYVCPQVDTTGAMPGSRWGASGWTDSGGNFWLFGGWGQDSVATNGNGALNDTWVYTPNSVAGQPGTWTWIKGSNTGSDNGVYGDELRPYKTYEIWTPGGRSNATHWVDGNGQLWMFGGEGYDSTSTTGNGSLNDMWRYLPYPD